MFNQSSYIASSYLHTSNSITVAAKKPIKMTQPKVFAALTTILWIRVNGYPSDKSGAGVCIATNGVVAKVESFAPTLEDCEAEKLLIGTIC